MNIIAVSDGEDSSATIVMNQLIPHSKHNIKLVQFNPIPHITKDTDIAYIHYGGLMNRYHPNNLKWVDIENLKVVAGIRGESNFKRWLTDTRDDFLPFVHKLDAISCANENLSDRARQLTDVPVFTCHSGVDLDMFDQRPLPEEFSIGWAGDSGNGAKMFPDFESLPFPQKIARSLPYTEMPDFYEGVSLYVSTSVEEGSAVPPKEASAMGRPVIAVRCGDFPEWIPPQFLFDSYKDTIPTIEKFKSNPRFLREWGEKYRKLSFQWDYKTVIKEYDKMFDSVSE